MTSMQTGRVVSVLRFWLSLLWWLTWLAVAAIVVASAVSVVTGEPVGSFLGVPVAFELERSHYAYVAPGGGVGSAELTDTEGVLEFDAAGRPVIAAYALVALILAGVMLFVIRQLRRVFRTLAAGKPFTIENAVRIRQIGLILIAAEVVESFLVFVSQMYVERTFETTGLTIDPRFAVQMSTIFAGLVLLVVAEVFRLGTRLREDQELTV